MAVESEDARRIFRAYVDEHGSSGPIGRLAAELADGQATRTSFDEVFGARPAGWLKPALLDLLLFYVSRVLSHHEFELEEQRTLGELKVLFRVQEGDFLKYRRAEVAALLAEQLAHMLEDDEIDNSEALQQVELQRAFDLSYDEYLALTRGTVEAAVERLVERTEASWSTDDEVEQAYSKLNAIATVYLLSASQRRRIGHRY